MSDNNDTRKLTEAEQKRVDAFKVTEDRLTAEGYVRKDLTISIEKANLVGPLLVLPIIAVVIVVFAVLRGFTPFIEFWRNADILTSVWVILAALSFVPLAIVHEGIHGVCWGIFAGNHMKDIEYGFIKEKITPYCYCQSPLSKGAYIFGSMMPMTVLGLLVCILGIAIASPIAMFIGVMQLVGGAGDILITFMLLRYNSKGKDAILMDHPTECGLIVFEKGM